MPKIQGKQIADNSITQNNLNISFDSIINSTDVTNKEYVIYAINSGISNLTYSTSDLNFNAIDTTGTTSTLASNRQVTDIPTGGVRVFINGLEANVGENLDCFFAPENTGIPTPRIFGEEQQGDYLWWNPVIAKYQLETVDYIDFVYMTYIPIN